MPKIDIIIPIYNAYKFTEECIKSVIKYTDLSEHNLLLINDKSPDEKILPMLKKYAGENPNKNIIVLDNEENLGFVKTVNKGMQYSENDVILLNSDTEVTKNWLEKIKNCAYQNEYIATVTPLTNNGTIASVPNFGMDNELPKNMTLDEYAEMIEKCSLNRFPELTTANGFCMFIKRSVIQEVGLFDDVTFGKGYGEENDFCYRALNRGYIHILCDNTFVYHKGTQSFKKENLTADRVALIEEHMQKLRAKHEVYVNKTDHYLSVNPGQDIQENVKINLELYGKRKILFLVNEWEENMEMTGGTSLHIKDIIQKMRQKDACFVMCPDKNDLSRIQVYLYTENIGRILYNVKTELGMYGQLTFHEQTYYNVLDKLFESFRFDIVHVHHFLFQTFDVIDIAKKYQAYTIATLHDLYMLCPSINMLHNGKFCREIKPENCKECFAEKHKISENVLDIWRKNGYKTLQKFDKIIVPSENTKKLFLSTYQDLKIDVIEHGVEVLPLGEHEKSEKTTFDIAFVGAMEKHKGSEVLKKLIAQNKNPNIKIHLFGKTFDKTLENQAENYIYHGPYQRGELPQLLANNQINLVCMFTIWPETYSYTLTETYMAKIPVLAYDIGAVADRLKKDKLGWIVPTDSSADTILEKIEEIKKQEQEYQKVKKNFENYNFKTVEKMQEEYWKIYENSGKIKNEIVHTNSMDELQRKTDVYDLRVILVNTNAELNTLRDFKNRYNFLVERFQKRQNTKWWQTAKKIKGFLKGNKND